ncbi:hypothetical protein [Planococcus salinus]|uniref:Uncharacterized protein n=1 Tax=Planococcus salinus TaxID=1848460 RepID=A0A3M8P8J9_9BACL|nr:hypothetical protein [Planococcus salinus]RNF39997.1 hypothetical protein EEX84_05000 [Planococcus salinus]
MTGSYVLEIPDLHEVLSQEDVARWKIFLTTDEKEHHKVNWSVSSADNSFMFHNSFLLDKRIKSVEIDFTDNRVTFYKGESDADGFKEFLDLVLSKMFIRINPNQMHFLVSPKYSQRKSTRK